MRPWAEIGKYDPKSRVKKSKETDPVMTQMSELSEKNLNVSPVNVLKILKDKMIKLCEK